MNFGPPLPPPPSSKDLYFTNPRKARLDEIVSEITQSNNMYWLLHSCQTILLGPK